MGRERYVCSTWYGRRQQISYNKHSIIIDHIDCYSLLLVDMESHAVFVQAYVSLYIFLLISKSWYQMHKKRWLSLFMSGTFVDFTSWVKLQRMRISYLSETMCGCFCLYREHVLTSLLELSYNMRISYLRETTCGFLCLYRKHV